jgi:hypothetical protein
VQTAQPVATVATVSPVVLADSAVTVEWHLALATLDPMATAATVARAVTQALAETAETAPTVTKVLLQVAAVARVATLGTAAWVLLLD